MKKDAATAAALKELAEIIEALQDIHQTWGAGTRTRDSVLLDLGEERDILTDLIERESR